MTNEKRTKDQEAEADPEENKETPPEAVAVQNAVEEAQRQGYFGAETDSTPNENYTVSGVTSGAPTPETNAEQAKKVRGE